MIIKDTVLSGLKEISYKVIEDKRGGFLEIFNNKTLAMGGLDINFVQENMSISKRNVVRGLHFQWDPPLGKLVRVSMGTAFAIAVDIRKNSPTLGQKYEITLDDKNEKALFVPFGFAFGFCAVGEVVQVNYYYTALYNPKGESSIVWNDLQLAINWPVTNPILSERDEKAQSFSNWLSSKESDFIL